MTVGRKWCALFMVFALGCQTSKATVAASAPEATVVIGDDAVLLLDDRIIAESQHVQRIVHPGRKDAVPALEPTHPWEGDRLYVMGTPHYDEATNEFRLWYMARTMVGRKTQDYVLHATSKDGVNWDRPNLGIYDYNGSTDNNILLDHVHSPSVVVETTEEGDCRYRMVAMRYSPRGYHTATSEDGLHWPTFIKAVNGGDNVTMTRDRRTKQYLMFNRQRVSLGGHDRRAIFLSVSDDFISWSDPTPVMVPDDRDDASWVTDPRKERTEFYNMTVLPYESHYLGFLTVCHFKPTAKVTTTNQSSTDGPIHVELVHSHDGRTWHRLESREPILEPGPAQWDQGMILSLSSPIVHDDEVWIYYTGFNVQHGGPRPPKRSVIGRAVWKRDRFVALRAVSEHTGVIETVLLNPGQQHFQINVDASQGRVTAELLDARGNVIPGYECEACIAITGDDLRASLRWEHQSMTPVDQPFRARLYLEKSELFSIRFVTPAAQ